MLYILRIYGKLHNCKFYENNSYKVRCKVPNIKRATCMHVLYKSRTEPQ